MDMNMSKLITSSLELVVALAVMLQLWLPSTYATETITKTMKKNNN